MLVIDSDGMCLSLKIKRLRKRRLERGYMPVVRGVIVHQTAAAKAKSTLDHYDKGEPFGAHFLIDTDGTIMQTASIFQRTMHVGPLNARCVWNGSCSPAKSNPGSMATHRAEMRKQVPDRFPANHDSIGIELVGAALPNPTRRTNKKADEYVFEAVNELQNASLKWLVAMLVRKLEFSKDEIFPHPLVSPKTSSEASTAKW